MNIEYNDVDDIENYGVQASLTEDEVKLTLFKDYIKHNTQFNPKKLEASAKFFYNFGNRAQCEKFADLFLESVESVFSVHHRDYALQFFMHLSPTFLKRPQDLEKFKEIQER